MKAPSTVYCASFLAKRVVLAPISKPPVTKLFSGMHARILHLVDNSNVVLRMIIVRS
jgi:hypothetical protein